MGISGDLYTVTFHEQGKTLTIQNQTLPGNETMGKIFGGFVLIRHISFYHMGGQDVVKSISLSCQI